MEYYNCNNNQWINELIKLQYVQRLLYQQKNYKSFCKQRVKQSSKKINNDYKLEMLAEKQKYLWSNSTAKNKNNGLFGFLLKRGLAISNVLKSTDQETILPTMNLIQECKAKVLPAEKQYYENYGKCKTLENILQYENKVHE